MSTIPAAASSAPGRPVARLERHRGGDCHQRHRRLDRRRQAGQGLQYTDAARRLSGSQNAASSFSLNSGNTGPKDIVTDGTSLWVVNDSPPTRFQVHALGLAPRELDDRRGRHQPDGHHARPVRRRQLWIVDSGTERVYQFDNGKGPTAGSHRRRRALPCPRATPIRKASPTRPRAAR